MKIIAWIAVAAAAFLFFGYLNPPSPERQRLQTVIAECWKDYDRKVFDPSTKIFIAKTCEKFEADLAKAPR